MRAVHYPEECSIGKWLLSEHTLHLRTRPEYLAVVEQHSAFHGQMLAIALAIVR